MNNNIRNFSEEMMNKTQNAFSKENMIQSYLREYDKNGIKYRVLLIDVNCKHSSTGKIVFDLYSYLMKNGREAAICYGRGNKVNGKNIIKFALDFETFVHALLARVTGYNGYFSPISTRRLISYIEKFKPDLVHINELHAYFVNHTQLVKYLEKKGIPIIWTFHCDYMYTGKCGIAYKCTKYKEGCGHCPALGEYPKTLFFDHTKEMLKEKMSALSSLNFSIVTPSEWLADRVKSTYLKYKPITVIHNGIDTSIFHPCASETLRKTLGISDEYKVILAVAPNIMTDRNKGGQWVLRLAELLKDEKLIFVIIGDKEETTFQLSNVIFIEAINDPYLLAQYYSMADLYVLFSQFETFSLTCAEALCCGTPVIGFKCGAPESIFADYGATFFEYGDIEGVKNEIIARFSKNILYSNN